MFERRHLERFNLCVTTRLIIFNGSLSKEVLETSTSNICAGGAFFKIGHTIPEGAQVHLNFVLTVKKLKKLIGASSFIKITGTVVRSEFEGIAVSFASNYEILPFRIV